MTSKLIAQGAEAKIILSNKTIIKDRISKSYRISELDKRIRKSRTKAEAKLLNKASKIVNIPIPIIEDKKNFQIKMHYIDGQRLSDNLDKFPLEKQKTLCKEIGREIAKLHDAHIIHGDLTTSNLILMNYKKVVNKKRGSNKNVHNVALINNKKLLGGGGGEGGSIIFFIDFGLGYISSKFEDKAVDIHLFKQALEAKHFRHWEILFKEFQKGYETSKNSKIVFERLKAVEKRGRYKH